MGSSLIPRNEVREVTMRGDTKERRKRRKESTEQKEREKRRKKEKDKKKKEEEEEEKGEEEEEEEEEKKQDHVSPLSPFFFLSYFYPISVRPQSACLGANRLIICMYMYFPPSLHSFLGS
jgi:hypothetical protein